MEKTVNIYTDYEIHMQHCGYDDYPTLENSLFEAGKLVKHVDIGKYTYSVYNIVFHRHETSSVANGFGKNAILIGADEFFCTS